MNLCYLTLIGVCVGFSDVSVLSIGIPNALDAAYTFLSERNNVYRFGGRNQVCSSLLSLQFNVIQTHSYIGELYAIDVTRNTFKNLPRVGGDTCLLVNHRSFLFYFTALAFQMCQVQDLEPLFLP